MMRFALALSLWSLSQLSLLCPSDAIVLASDLFRIDIVGDTVSQQYNYTERRDAMEWSRLVRERETAKESYIYNTYMKGNESESEPERERVR